jgi:tetrahydrodipicolinate N-succinyltransferase
MIRHLNNCHLNSKNSPKIEVDWEYWDEFNIVKDHLIKNPTTSKMKEFNKIIAPKGNPHEKFIEEMLSYTKSLPKTHKDRAIYQKLDEIFTSGIEVRQLNKEEYVQRLKEKVLMGQRIFLFDPLNPTTVEEIEQNKTQLWDFGR